MRGYLTKQFLVAVTFHCVFPVLDSLKVMRLTCLLTLSLREGSVVDLQLCCHSVEVVETMLLILTALVLVGQRVCYLDR